MIPVTVMTTGRGTVSKRIKGEFGAGRPSRFSDVWRPVVTWNITSSCNLRCLHCYIRAGPSAGEELSTEEALRIVRQMADVGIPLIIFSGGEPMLRRDLMSVMREAVERGMRVALSTNGTLITDEAAEELSKIGVSYVGISLDSPYARWHDEFRGLKGAFRATLKGIRNSIEAGLPTGLRLTLTSRNVEDAPALLELAEREHVERVTFYHLSAAGRASELDRSWYMTPAQYRWFMDYLVDASAMHEGMELETTMAPFDGIAIADRVARSRDEFWKLMDVVRAQGGCGRKMISIYPDGTVRPCQFVDFMSLGNIRATRIAELLDPSRPEVDYFANTWRYLEGPRCSTCQFREICGGGDRIRAYYIGGGLKGDDPQCPLDGRSIYDRWS